MAYLALVRHGESEWNARDLWTGWTDISLSEKGKRESRAAGEKLRGIDWNTAFVSDLKRSVETLFEIKQVLGIEISEVRASPAIKERDYGNFTGSNKVEVEEKYGEELFEKWHRGWDYPVPKGETLKDVYDRAVPYYLSDILPIVMSGKNVIVSIHGNSMRALVKFLDNISDEEIVHLEIPTGTVALYKLDEEGKVVERKFL